MTTTQAKIQSTACKPAPAYRSRIGVVVAHELRQVLRWPLFAISVGFGAFALTEAFRLAKTDTSAWAIESAFTNCVMLPQFFAILTSLNSEKTNRTLEPVFAAGIRRSDLVIGKFLVAALTYLVFVVSQVAVFLLLLKFPALVHDAPFLNSFRPTGTFVVMLIAVIASCGFELMALFYMLLSTEYAYRRRGALYLITGGVWLVIGLRFSHSWGQAILPMMNGFQGVFAVFERYGHAMLSHSVWQSVFNLPLLIIGAFAVTIVCLIVTIRNLECAGEFGTNKV